MNQVYNVALGARTTLNELFTLIRARVASAHPPAADMQPNYREFRNGDVRHSQAGIGKISGLLGYEPRYDVAAGLDLAAAYYITAAR
jgi:UDP-N-acetylglucosamine 4-epimerase